MGRSLLKHRLKRICWASQMVLAASAVLASPVVAANAVPIASADPLTVEIDTGDVDRFSTLFQRTGGKPSQEQLQHEYINPGSYGLSIFTPNRIIDAANLAKNVSHDPGLYERAIKTCLPIIKDTTPELRATYLSFRGLFPDKPLPHIYLVLGANNSGGTAGPSAQVLGLEVLCRISKTPEALRETMRSFYAHETVHVLQGDNEITAPNILLKSVLQEGAADFIARLVSGRQMDEKRADWALPREAELWRQFESDLQTTRDANWNDLVRGTPKGDAFYRWIANADNPPAGWSGEAGYWMGQRIWERWYNQQSDKKAALNYMLTQSEPDKILASGRFHSP